MAGKFNVAAVGIGVSDLAAATEFYTRALGLEVTQQINLPHLDETILGFADTSAAVVLMHWKDGVERSYRDNPGKLVLNTPDVHALVAQIKQAGYTVTQEPEVYKDFGNMTIAFAADPDGFQIEMLQAPG